ncbi:MAG TPA: alanyl-tRNA editing protein [Planctomycetota bacterium]|nr:alanyl-tRNA editing protein [Planctomycetota bacterium]
MTERLYQERPLVLSFESRVAAVRPGAKPEVRLEATAFYPTSGGQPHDTGFLDDARVVEVKEEGEEVWHVLEGDAPREGAVARGVVDEPRRRDHREQHSGQHLLSAVLLDVARVPTVAFHLGAEFSTIDVQAERIGRDLLDRVEKRASEIIRRNVPVTASVVHGDAARAQARSLRKAPEEVALASPRGLRVVEIQGIDRDACCGTHVQATGELGLVKVLSAERGKKGETRLTFVAGGRALAAFQERQAVLDELSQSLTTSFRDLGSRVQKIVDAEKAARLEARGLREEALEGRARKLAAAAPAFAKGGVLVLERLTGGDSQDARTLVSRVIAARKDALCAVVHEGEKLTLVVARGDQAPALDVAAALREALTPFGGKGGGQGGFAQGAAPVTGKGGEALALVEKALGK